jgi:hypothetical protein
MLRRLRFSRPALAVAAVALLASCAPHARIYSRIPVAEDGSPLPLDRVDTIGFEDDTRRSLTAGESVAFDDGSLVVLAGEDTESFDLQRVESLRVEHEGGVAEWFAVLTPDDLLRFERLPAIARIELRSGDRLTFGETDEEARRARWAPSRLAILVEPEDGGEPREILLDEIQTIELLENESVVETLSSPALWVVGAAAAGAIVLIGRNSGDPETTAVR